MGSYNGNRVKTYLARHDRVMQKRSGDQHMSGPDDQAEIPQRPRRISREEMENLVPPINDPDDPQSP